MDVDEETAGAIHDQCADAARKWLEDQPQLAAVAEHHDVLEVGIYAGVFGAIRTLVDLGLLED